MRGDRAPRTELRPFLDEIEAAPPAAAIDVFAAELAREVDARAVSFLITDLSGRSLVRLNHTGTPGDADAAETVPLAHTAYGRAVRTQQPQILPLDDGARLLTPVSSRGDAVGVLELAFANHPDEQTIAHVAAAARALAYVVIAERRYTDVYEWGQRLTPLTLAAEIQRRLLPDSFTCEADPFTLAGWLEPANTCGGDTFDYALDRDRLHVSVTDAMGHEVDAALLATLAVSSLRNSRRRGADLTEMAQYAAEAVDAHHIGEARFVTGQLLSVELATGAATIVNAGHPAPFRARDGRVSRFELTADLPLGVLPETGYRIQRLPLEPGDRVVFVTDGMLERNAADVDLPAAIAETEDLHPHETVQVLTAAILEATGGRLRDDATMLCLDWYGGEPQRRRSGARPATREGGAAR